MATRRTSASRIALLLGLLPLGSPPATLAGVTGPDALRGGRFLVASPALRDPNFAQSVVLLVRHDERGTVGLIVNRRLTLALEDALPDLERKPGASAPLHEGGPVETDSLVLLLHEREPLPGATPVLDGVQFSRSREVLELAVERSAERFRAYVGHAGWGPGQLDDELARGDWYVLPANAASIFETDPDNLWETLVPPDATRRAAGPHSPSFFARASSAWIWSGLTSPASASRSFSLSSAAIARARSGGGSSSTSRRAGGRVV